MGRRILTKCGLFPLRQGVGVSEIKAEKSSQAAHTIRGPRIILPVSHLRSITDSSGGYLATTVVVHRCCDINHSDTATTPITPSFPQVCLRSFAEIDG